MFDKKFKLLLNRVFSPDSIVFLTSYSPNNLNLQGSRTCLLPERQNTWPKKIILNWLLLTKHEHTVITEGD